MGVEKHPAHLISTCSHTLGYAEAILEALANGGGISPALALSVWGYDLIYGFKVSDSGGRGTEVFGAWLAAQGALAALR